MSSPTIHRQPTGLESESSSPSPWWWVIGVGAAKVNDRLLAPMLPRRRPSCQWRGLLLVASVAPGLLSGLLSRRIPVVVPVSVLLAADADRGNASSSSPSCRGARGRSGVWTYQGKPASWWRVQPSNATAKLTAGDWEWSDELENSPSHRHCGTLSSATLDSVCREMRRLSLTRIFFVGDSTTHMMVQSLWRLLSLGGGVPSQFRPFRRTVTCPTLAPRDDDDDGEHDAVEEEDDVAEAKPFQFEISFARNDHLDRNLDPNRKRLRNGPACGAPKTYCWPWIDSYVNGTTIGKTPDGGATSSSTEGGRTLLIVNMGVHFHDSAKYELAVNDFFDVTVPTIVNPNDVLWFRSSVPGHGHCENLTIPFADYAQYGPTRTSLFDWDLVEGYNNYVRSKIIANANATTVDASAVGGGGGGGGDDDESAHQSAARRPVVEMLDVFNMTVLRGDGHADCLHYDVGVAGGPVDWWVHLMVTNLMDIDVDPPGTVPVPAEV